MATKVLIDLDQLSMLAWIAWKAGASYGLPPDHGKLMELIRLAVDTPPEHTHEVATAYMTDTRTDAGG